MSLGAKLRADAAKLRMALATGSAGPLSEAQAWQWIARLFASVTGMSAVERTLREADPVSSLELADYDLALARLAEGVPFAYVVGEQDFMGRRFRVNPAVLIPRDDTAVLVQAAVDRIDARFVSRVLDLGTGSGCVAVSIAIDRPGNDVVAVDASAAALEVARGNARRLGAANVGFALTDWYLGAPPGPYDMVVANPPYIESDDPHLAALAHEPVAALVSGIDGLEDLRRIVSGAGAVLAPEGWLLVEHGYRQRDAVAALFDAAGFASLTLLDDPGGNARVVGGRRSGAAPSTMG